MDAENLEQSKMTTRFGLELPPNATFELSQEFYFEAAHSLERKFESEGSRRIHGHTYFARVAVKGLPDQANGMVVDLSRLRQAISKVRSKLDHQFLNEVNGLGPSTIESLCSYIAREISGDFRLSEVEVRRDASGDRCVLKLG